MHLTGKQATGEPVADEAAAGEPVTDESATGEPVTGEPVTGGPVTGGPVTGGPVTGGPVTGGRAARGRSLIVETDGGSRGNPGPAGFGAVVRDASTGAVLAEVGEAIGTATNNVAEYRGLLAGLRAAARLDPAAQVEVRADSKLVVEQMSGRWQIKHEDMRRLAEQARAVLPAAAVTYTWVPRAKNTHADRLANEAMDVAAGQTRTRGTTTPGGGPTVDGSAGGPGNAPGTPSTRRGSIRAPRGGESGEATTLIVVRHGRTPMTEVGRYSGWGGEDPELSEAGRKDADRVAALLAGLARPGALLPDIAVPTAVVASPTLRTRQTAAAVAQRLDVPVEIDEAWVEASFGDWEGLTYGELVRRFPAELARMQGSTTYAPPGGGESLDDVAERVRGARDRVVAAYPEQAVVVVTHATPVRVVLQEALDAGAAALWRVRVTAASVSVVRYWEDGGVEVAMVNSTAHLVGQPSGVP
jgi:probable phosphoglycerate mutase